MAAAERIVCTSFAVCPVPAVAVALADSRCAVEVEQKVDLFAFPGIATLTEVWLQWPAISR